MYMASKYNLNKRNREERRRMKELRKFKKMELLEKSDYEPSFLESNVMINICLFIFGACALLGFADIDLAIVLILCMIALIISLLFVESLLKSIISHVSEFFAKDKDRRRAYKETQKVIDYAIANNKISDEHITLMIENLVYNARAEQQSSIKQYKTIYLPDSDTNTIESNIESNTVNKSNAIDIIESKTITLPASNKLTLIFNEDSIDVMNGDTVLESVTYDEIIQPTTEEEISSMPYSTIYGYVKRADKTIYIDMENESAIIK